MDKQGMGTFLVLLSAAGFGLMGIFAKIAYDEGMSVGTLLTYRFAIAAALFWLWIGLSKPAYSLSVRERWILSGMGVFGYAVMATMMFSSFYYIPASLAEMLFYLYPTLVCLLMSVFEREPITRKKAAVLLLTFIGILFVLGVPAGKGRLLGELYAFGAAVVYAVFIMYSNRLVKQVPPLVGSAHIATASAITLLLLAVVKGDLHAVSGTASWLTIIGIAVFSTFIAILAFFEGVQRIGSSRASILSTMEPIVTLLFSAVLFHERLAAPQWIGVLLVIGSLIALEMRMPARLSRLYRQV